MKRARDVLDAIGAVVARRRDATLALHPLQHRAGAWDFAVVTSKDLDARDRVVFLQAGLHGDEIAGPIAIARHLDEIVDHAHARGLGVWIHPLANPSGFDRGTRYNADHDRGDAGNGDFLRYVMDDGAIVDEPPPGRLPSSWCWSIDAQIALPAETRLASALLRAGPVDRVVAAIDLHQDRLTPGLPPSWYAYVFGDRARYAAAVDAASRVVPPVASMTIGAGFGVEIDAQGRAVRGQSDARHPSTDARGLIERSDGGITDLFVHLGARHGVAVETTGATSIADAVAVNLAWLRAVIDAA